MKHSALTTILKVKPGQEETFKAFLLEIGNNIKKNPYIKFNTIETLHFCRFVMFDDDKRVFFSCNLDGEIDSHLDEWVRKARSGVEKIFQYCVGCPDPSLNDFEYSRAFCNWIKSQSIPANVFFRAYAGRSRHEALNAIRIRDQIDKFLNMPAVEPYLSALATLPFIPPKENPFGALFNATIGRLLGGIFPLIIKMISPPISNKPTTEQSPDVTVPYAVTEREQIVQNELTIISKIDPKYINNLKNVFRIISIGTNLPGDGTLSGVATIHFARWAIFDNDTMLYFESNYDGAWESYIGEFIDRAAMGLDAIWGCCVDYPERGAKDAQAFKKQIIDHQFRAQLFYSSYPYTSVKNIISDLKVMDYLSKWFNQQAVADFFRRL